MNTVVLDSTPLGLLCHPRNPPPAAACRQWLVALQTAGRRVVLPEIIDYEIRRELIRTGRRSRPEPGGSPMSAVPKRKLTEAEYLAIEREAEFKSEFYDGVMYPIQGPGAEGPYGMAGPTFSHNAVKENMAFELAGRLRGGPCQVLSSDMKVKVSRTRMFVYPDVLIVCGPPQFADDKEDTLLNPAVIVEVLSPATEKYDRGAKFRHYQQLESLQEYVRVAQDEAVCERFRRLPGEQWELTTVTGLGAVLEFATVPVRVPLTDIYAGITFPDKPLR